MARVALYARYSSDLQRDASIADQLRICRERAAQIGAEIVAEFSDAALSGALPPRKRPGLRALLEAAQAGRVDMVMAEALDRLSRDQEDIAGLFKRLRHAGVQLLTLAEGEISELHIGLKGTMNALFLKDLAAKVRRGMRGRVVEGRNPSGKAYGYDVVRRFGADGRPEGGLRRINRHQAAIVRRIFREYLAGRSPRQIAGGLNRDGVKPPRGPRWSVHSIYGNPAEGRGILANPIYRGQLVWNRRSFSKDPDSGTMRGRLNPAGDVLTVDVPALRIIDEATWRQVEARQAARAIGPFHRQRAPKRLLSGLLFCKSCGGPCSMVLRGYAGCTANKQNGTCDNRRLIRMDEVERRVLDGLRDRLLAPDMVEAFARRYRETWARRRAELARGTGERQAERRDMDRKIARLVGAIEDGTDTPELRSRLRELTAQRDQLAGEQLEADQARKVVELHPNLGDAYRRQVAKLEATLRDDRDGERHAKALGIVRSLVERVVLVPGKVRRQVGIELHGQIAGILALAGDDPRTTFKRAGVPPSTLYRNWPPLVVAC